MKSFCLQEGYFPYVVLYNLSIFPGHSVPKLKCILCTIIISHHKYISCIDGFLITPIANAALETITFSYLVFQWNILSRSFTLFSLNEKSMSLSRCNMFRAVYCLYVLEKWLIATEYSIISFLCLTSNNLI